MHKKINVLICAPGALCEGGIGAVVDGLLDGLEKLETVNCTRVVYGKPFDAISVVTRLYYELIQYINFIRLLVVQKPDIVHAQSSFDKKTILRDLLFLLATRAFSIKFVLHAHGGAWHERVNWSFFWQWFSRYFLESCSMVLVTSEEEFLQVQKISEQICIKKIDNPVKIPEGVAEAWKKTADHLEGKYRMVFASRHIEAKGVLDTIEAFDLLERNDCELHVFGDGPLKEKAVSMAQSSTHAADIYFHGNVPLEDLIREYAQSDIYLFPSYHHEGFPMALFFAAACSLPLICTKVRPLPDFFQEPDNCQWVEPRNPRMLAEKINFLLNDSQMRSAMSCNNLQLVERFDSIKIAEQMLSIYDSITGKP